MVREGSGLLASLEDEGPAADDDEGMELNASFCCLCSDSGGSTPPSPPPPPMRPQVGWDGAPAEGVNHVYHHQQEQEVLDRRQQERREQDL